MYACQGKVRFTCTNSDTVIDAGMHIVYISFFVGPEFRKKKPSRLHVGSRTGF